MGRKKKGQVLQIAKAPRASEVDRLFAETRSRLENVVILGETNDSDELLTAWTSDIDAPTLLYYAKLLELMALEVVTLEDVESWEE